MESDVAQKLKTIKILIKAGAFDKAEKMIALLEKAEEEKSGCCEIAEVYWCKVLVKYQARDEAELVSKNPDLDSDVDFSLALGFSQTNEQKQLYSTILEQTKRTKDTLHKEDGSVNLNIGDFKDIGGGYVTFGTYPQGKKADDVKIGKIIDTECGYYLGSDNNLYVEWHGEYYKIEPIKWKVLSCANNEWFIVADVILEPHRFDESSNNYANSEIRSWLNADFYYKAFSNIQKSIIMTTTVDNSSSSTCCSKNEFACANTSDKVFLLSLKEAIQYLGKESRKRIPTGYAIARGALQYTDNDNKYKREGTGCGVWWLRSPSFLRSNAANIVNYDGSSNGCDYTNPISLTGLGVVPAIKIKP